MAKFTLTEVLDILKIKKLDTRPVLALLVYKTANLYLNLIPDRRAMVKLGIFNVTEHFSVIFKDKTSVSGHEFKRELQSILDKTTGLNGSGRMYAEPDGLPPTIPLTAVSRPNSEPPIRSKGESERGKRLADAAQSLVGSFSWAGPSNPDTDTYKIGTRSIRTRRERGLGVNFQTVTEHTINTFAVLMKKESATAEDLQGLIADTGAMFNCWEAVLVCAAKASLVTLHWLQGLHKQAASLAKGHHFEDSVVEATKKKEKIYFDTIQNTLEIRPPEPLTALHLAYRGDLIFFNGFEHVAIAAGGASAQMYSLYDKDYHGRPADKPVPFMRVPIASISGTRTFSACPF